MKTYNEIVDDLEALEKSVPQQVNGALTEAKSYTDTEVASGVAEAKQYADTKFSAGLKRLVVESLPVEDIDSNTIYMVLDSTSSQVGNVYNEYMYINSGWELIGTTATASAPLYQHTITLNGDLSGGKKNYVLFNIISDSATPFTFATLTSYMQTHYNLNTWFSGINCTGYIFNTSLILYIQYNNGLNVANVDLGNPSAGLQNSNIDTWVLTNDHVVQLN